jgi:hypothetical protein
MNDQDDLIYEVSYPPRPLAIGSELIIEDMVLGGPTEACLMAEQIFRRKNGPLRATVIPSGPAEWVRSGQRHLITWTVDQEGTLLQGANFVVKRVQFGINLGRATGDAHQRKSWDCTVTLDELIF